MGKEYQKIKFCLGSTMVWFFVSLNSIGQTIDISKFELLRVSDSINYIFSNDTTIYTKDNIPYSGTDSIYIEDILSIQPSILKDTCLFVIEYLNGYKKKVTEFYKAGQKKREMIFENGLIDGSVITWYLSGGVQSISQRHKGRQVGPSLTFYENGNIEWYTNSSKENKIENFDDIGTKWYPSGKIAIEIKPVCGGKGDSFIETRYFENGTISLKMVSNNGKQIFIQNYSDGKKAEEGFIVDGPWNKVGKWTRWYSNGQKMAEEFYKDSQTSQNANFRIGTWSRWDEQGNLIKQEIYKDNKLVETKEFLPKIKKE